MLTRQAPFVQGSATRSSDPAVNAANARALGNALVAFLVIPWTLSLIFYTGDSESPQAPAPVCLSTVSGALIVSRNFACNDILHKEETIVISESTQTDEASSLETEASKCLQGGSVLRLVQQEQKKRKDYAGRRDSREADG